MLFSYDGHSGVRRGQRTTFSSDDEKCHVRQASFECSCADLRTQLSVRERESRATGARLQKHYCPLMRPIEVHVAYISRLLTM